MVAALANRGVVAPSASREGSKIGGSYDLPAGARAFHSIRSAPTPAGAWPMLHTLQSVQHRPRQKLRPVKSAGERPPTSEKRELSRLTWISHTFRSPECFREKVAMGDTSASSRRRLRSVGVSRSV